MSRSLNVERCRWPWPRRLCAPGWSPRSSPSRRPRSERHRPGSPARRLRSARHPRRQLLHLPVAHAERPLRQQRLRHQRRRGLGRRCHPGAPGRRQSNWSRAMRLNFSAGAARRRLRGVQREQLSGRLRRHDRPAGHHAQRHRHRHAALRPAARGPRRSGRPGYRRGTTIAATWPATTAACSTASTGTISPASSRWSAAASSGCRTRISATARRSRRDRNEYGGRHRSAIQVSPRIGTFVQGNYSYREYDEAQRRRRIRKRELRGQRAASAPRSTSPASCSARWRSATTSATTTTTTTTPAASAPTAR